MGEKGNKTGTGMLIIVLSIVLLIGIVTLYINAKYQSKTTNNSQLHKLSIKQDNTKPYIYNKKYKTSLTKAEQSYQYIYNGVIKTKSLNDIKVPYININTEDAVETNKTIKQLFNQAINQYKQTYKNIKNNQTQANYDTTISYKSYKSSQYLSLVLKYKIKEEQYQYLTYNFNLNDGHLLTYKEAYSIAGFTDKTIKTSVNYTIESKCQKYQIQTNQELYTQLLTNTKNNYQSNVLNNTILYYLNKNKKLNIIIPFEVQSQIDNNYIILQITYEK